MSTWDYELVELLLHLEAATYIYNSSNIYCSDTYISY